MNKQAEYNRILRKNLDNLYYYYGVKTMKRSELVPGKTYTYGEVSNDYYIYIGIDEYNNPVFKSKANREFFTYPWSDTVENTYWKEKRNAIEQFVNVYRDFDGVESFGGGWETREEADRRASAVDHKARIGVVHFRWSNGKAEIVDE